MPNWIRLDNDQVVETTDTDPKGRFHPDLKWTKAAVGVQAGMVKQADGSFGFSEPAPENAIAATLTPATPLTKLAFIIQTCRIDQSKLNIIDRHHFFYSISRGSGYITHYSTLFVEQQIQ